MILAGRGRGIKLPVWQFLYLCQNMVMLYIQQNAVIKKWMVTGTSGNAGVEVCYE